MKTVTDKAEISVDFPDKAYMGSFGRHSQYGVTANAEGICLKLVHPGEDRRVVELNIHYYLLADILDELADALAAQPHLDEGHRKPMLDAAKRLDRALASRPSRSKRKRSSSSKPRG